MDLKTCIIIIISSIFHDEICDEINNLICWHFAFFIQNDKSESGEKCLQLL